MLYYNFVFEFIKPLILYDINIFMELCENIASINYHFSVSIAEISRATPRFLLSIVRRSRKTETDSFKEFCEDLSLQTCTK